MVRKRPKFYWAFYMHIRNAAKRNIEFLLTYEEWIKIWLDSGHLFERGQKSNQYCMARFEDKGPYAVGNVKIITSEENIKEKVYSEEIRKKMSVSKLGNKNNTGKQRRFPMSEEHRKKISVIKTGKKRVPFSAEWCEKISIGNKGKKRAPFTKEHCKNISIGKQKRQERERQERERC